MGDKITVLLRLNGVGNAFLRELGCSCPQCATQKPRANTSASLIIKSESKAAGRVIKHHVLFDCGLGVVDSLIDYGLRTVSHIFISHNHNDHVLELDRLVQSHFRSNGTGPSGDTRLPCYCTEGTWERGPKKHFEYLPLTWTPVKPGQAIDLDLGVALRVNAVGVYHGSRNIVPDPVIWVLQFGDVKVVLGWDLLRLEPGYPNEDWEDPPSGRKQMTNEILGEHEILRHADELFLEANTFSPQPQTGHTSVRAVVDFYARYLEPKGRTWIVHYSGHEDAGGPLSDVELQAKVNRCGPKAQVLVAPHGMTLNWAMPG